jgi:hypothetical protein
MKKVALLSLTLTALLTLATAAEAGVVYLGLDPSAHGQPQAPALVDNAVQFAGGGTNPTIALVGDNSGGANSLLTSLGYTNITVISSANLGATNLNNFDMLYVALSTSNSTLADLVAASAQIDTYVNGGGGLLVEPQVFAAGSWSWVPLAGQIGHSGATNVATETVVIVDSLHPVMAGLTNAGLSNWGFSVHSFFATAGAAGFDILAVDGQGRPVIVALQNQAVPEPASMLAWGLLTGVGLVGYRLRRRKLAA